MDTRSEKWTNNEQDDSENEENLDDDPANIEPKFFRTPSGDLLPSAAAVAAARRKSSVRSLTQKPAPTAEARRRSFAQSPLKSIASPDGLFPGNNSSDQEVPLQHKNGDGDGDMEERFHLVADTEDQETIHFGGPYTMENLKEELRELCTLQTLQHRLPIVKWLPKYSREDLLGDLVAGLTVGFTVVPQCLAYAQIADIDVEYGLNSAYIGCFIYGLLGTSKDVTVGPTAILSLLTGAFIRREGGNAGQWAILLCFFVGCFQLLMGLLRLGFLINFISVPVVSGFTQAAVIVIILSQIKNMMGVKFGSAKDNVVQTLAGYVGTLKKINAWDVLMGCICISLLLLMRDMKMPKRKGRDDQPPPKWWNFIKTAIRLTSVSRYAIVVVVATSLEYILEEVYDIRCFSATGNVTATISAPKPPNFNADGFSFGGILSEFGSGLVLVPLLATMESIAVAKTFAHKFRYNIDTTQEFLALGTSNIISSFFGSYPVTGAFTRSALAAESGVRTPMGCIVTGTFVVIAILLLGPLFQYIPKAALAAVIICACLTMFDFQIFRELWYIRKSELFVLVTTMAMCLFLRVEYGLLIGLAVSILMLLYPMARPVVIVNRRRKELHLVSPKLEEYKINVIPQGAIFFPAAEYVKEIFNDALFSTPVTALANRRESTFNGTVGGTLLNRDEQSAGTMHEALPPIIFDGIHLTSSDYSTLRALRGVFVNCKAAHRDLVFINTSDEILDIIMPFRKKRKPAAQAANISLDMNPAGDLEANGDRKNSAIPKTKHLN